MKTKPTAVIFRTFNKGSDVIALFPYEPGTTDPATGMSYQAVGQHGSASIYLTREGTRPASAREAAPLRQELERFGYKLRVLQRVPPCSMRRRTNAIP